MENNNKPMTAVEWLELEYKKQGFLYDLDVEAAKQMEKEQIMKAFSRNYMYPDDIPASEKYYNETYGK